MTILICIYRDGILLVRVGEGHPLVQEVDAVLGVAQATEHGQQTYPQLLVIKLFALDLLEAQPVVQRLQDGQEVALKVPEAWRSLHSSCSRGRRSLTGQ